MKKIIFAFFLLSSCGNIDTTSNRLFLSNMGDPDEVTFKIFIDEKLLLTEKIENENLSFHWSEFDLELPKTEFKIGVEVSSPTFVIKRDSIIKTVSDSLFISYDFVKHHKRYDNPEIISHMQDGVEINLQSFADSLYANNLLTNSSEYLNDTVPLSGEYIDIFIK